MNSFDSRSRAELAQRIAAYIVDNGMTWAAARDRAVKECGKGASGQPSASEVETAVRAHFALFEPQEHAADLREKRKLALRMLTVLKGFDCFLTGAVLNGAATRDSPVVIELFTDDVKAVLASLMDEGFDPQALDPQASAFSRARESIGVVVAHEGELEAVRIDILQPHLMRSNPARRTPDEYQADWEAQGRISAENLRKALENSSIS